jgi:outer membrane biosynthesis protein TonB
MPQTPIAAVAATNVATTNDAGSTVNLTQTSAESMPPVSNFPAVVASEASSVPPVHPADASTHDASSLQEKLPHPQVAVSAKALKKPEVMIRVSVDHEGRAQAFHILQGDKKKIPAAMEAARRWSFQPCSGPADCEHLLKFTDRGDASIMQMID